MLKIPIGDIISKIKEKTGLSEEDINRKINDKLEQLSGLISEEGAAHIIANELGVKVFEQVSGKLQIKNILPGMRSVETAGKVTAIYEVREFQKGESTGKVGSFMIGDDTGTIRIVCWGTMADKIKELKDGDIVGIKNAYSRDNQGRKEVHLNDNSLITLNPEGVEIGEVKAVSSETTRKAINELKENDSNVQILGTIVQAFDMRFFEVCPQCGKRARVEGDSFTCSSHGTVNPDFSFVMNVFLDDSTENIRVVCFRDQAKQLLKKTKEEILKYKDEPQSFEDVKTELLGNIILLDGRVVKNSMFDRLEFIANNVNPDPDPEKEIKKIKEK